MTKNHFPFIDLHQDILVHLRHKNRFGQEHQTSFEDIVSSGGKVVIASAFPVPDDMDFLNPKTNNMIEDDFEWYLAHAKKSPNCTIIKDSGDLKKVLTHNDSLGLILHIEGLNAMEDTPDHWNMLEKWHNLGWRSLGIVWNLKNSLGGGTKDESSGLTPLGAKVLDWSSKQNIITDYAHMNEQTFWDVSKISKKPILVSHGNSHECCPTPRNYTDKQLRAIGESGGVIGVFFSKKFVTHENEAEIAHVVAHIRHIRDIAGIDHLAIGTDFGGITSGTVKNLSEVKMLPSLWDALQNEGFSSNEIEKIAFKNAAGTLEAHFTS